MTVQSRDRQYINALPPDALSAIALGVLLVNRSNSDDEKTVDLLVENDRINTILTAIREHVGAEWGFFESWVIDAGTFTAAIARGAS